MFDESSVDTLVKQFDKIDMSELTTASEVVSVVKAAEDILNDAGLFTVHHISESVEELEDEDTCSITSPLVEENSDQTGMSFVVSYTKTNDSYEVFIDVDYTESVEADLDLSEEDYVEPDDSNYED